MPTARIMPVRRAPFLPRINRARPSFPRQAQQDFYQFRALLSARATTPPLPLLTAPRRSHCIQPLSQGSLPPSLVSDPATPCTVPSTPRAALYRPVPRITSASTRGISASKVPAATPSRICTLTSQTALSEIVYSTPRIGSAANPTSKRGLRPQIFAFHPTSNAVGIVTSWAVMMQAEVNAVSSPG